MTIQFYGGTGKHFNGSVNYLINDGGDIRIYAEIMVEDAETASDDYGYITMRDAVISKLEELEIDAGEIEWFYAGKDEDLEEDARADAPVYIEIDDREWVIR